MQKILQIFALVFAWLGNHQHLYTKPVEPKQSETRKGLSGLPCKGTNWYLLWQKGSRTPIYWTTHIEIVPTFLWKLRNPAIVATTATITGSDDEKLLGAAMNASCTFATLDSKRLLSDLPHQTRQWTSQQPLNYYANNYVPTSLLLAIYYTHIYRCDDPAHISLMRLTITV